MLPRECIPYLVGTEGERTDGMCLPFRLLSIDSAGQSIFKGGAMSKRTPDIERKNYDALAAPVAAYSHAVRNANTLYLSGFHAFGTAAQGKSVGEQANEILNQIKAVATAEGTDMSSLVKITTFLTDIRQIGELREAFTKNFTGNLPASTTVEVSKLFSPAIHIEIEAILGL